MTKIKFIFFICSSLILLTGCESVSKKIDAKTIQEEKELSKWLNQPESELKIVFGLPNKIEFTDQGTRNYIYITESYLNLFLPTISSIFPSPSDL